jgi:hypothetical protein
MTSLSYKSHESVQRSLELITLSQNEIRCVQESLFNLASSTDVFNWLNYAVLKEKIEQ